jgi:hypothetical protein
LGLHVHAAGQNPAATENRTMAKRTANPEPTAAETYAARRADIARLLDVLDMELARHAEAAQASPRDWGFAGSLGKVRGDLIAAVGCLSNMDPAEVERFLDAAD